MSTGLWPGALTGGNGLAPDTSPPDSTDSDDSTPERAATAGSAQRERRWWRWVLVLGALVVAAALLTRSGPAPTSSAAYHPANPTFNGAQALARVLAARGVEVVVAEGKQQLQAERIDADTTVLVTATGDLREPTIDELARLARYAERLVLVRPERRVIRQLLPGVGIRDAFREQPALTSDCAGPDVRPGEQLSRSQAEYSAGRVSASCFVTDGFAVYLKTEAPGLREVVLIGSTDVVTNERILDADNGAVALRTLGRSARLVWYVPDLRDVPPTEAERAETFAPPWWGPMLLLLGFTLGAVFWWRGRRFGRLVTEPLPVVVRAVETTESRGRMYHRARDTGRAADVLREATRRRVGGYLGLPAGTAADQVAQAAAAATRRPLEEIRWLLHGSAPPTDADLLGLAAALAALEKEIRRS